MENPKKVSIVINDAVKFKHDLADLTCWFAGFKAGIETNPNNNIDLQLPSNGMEIVKKINYLLENEIYKQ